MEMADLAESLGMWNLLHRSREFCLANIGKVAEAVADFFAMDVTTFEDILTNGQLKVPKEETIVELMISWVLFDKDKRQQFMPRLIRHVRLGFQFFLF